MKQENPMLMAETLQGEMQEDEVMSEEQLQGVISAEIYDAISFIDDDIGGNRALATDKDQKTLLLPNKQQTMLTLFSSVITQAFHLP